MRRRIGEGMKYQVRGVGRADGKDRAVVVEANDEREAATKSGLMVESVLTMEAAMSSIVPPVTQRPVVFIPTYTSVKIAGEIIRVLGWITIACSIFVAVIGAVEGARGERAALLMVTPALVGILGGALQVGFGSFILMARDAARHLQTIRGAIQ